MIYPINKILNNNNNKIFLLFKIMKNDNIY